MEKVNEGDKNSDVVCMVISGNINSLVKIKFSQGQLLKMCKKMIMDNQHIDHEGFCPCLAVLSDTKAYIVLL